MNPIKVEVNQSQNLSRRNAIRYGLHNANKDFVIVTDTLHETSATKTCSVTKAEI